MTRLRLVPWFVATGVACLGTGACGGGSESNGAFWNGSGAGGSSGSVASEAGAAGAGESGSETGASAGESGSETGGGAGDSSSGASGHAGARTGAAGDDGAGGEGNAPSSAGQGGDTQGLGCTEDPGDACDTARPGVCASGTRRCVDGEVSCVADTEASDEICDGLDNDCNGETDDGVTDLGGACETGALGICAAGIEVCVDAEVVCLPLEAAAAEETCGDELDNDCNGEVDDRCCIEDPGDACDTGQPGVCAAGTVRCVDREESCVPDTEASDEVCDGLDNDCNGEVDDDPTGLGGPCGTGEPGICAAGTLQCVEGARICVANETADAEETCGDDLDNDCNGEADDGCSTLGELCSTSCDGMICSSSSSVCEGSDLSSPCVGTAAGMYCSQSCATDADCTNPNIEMKCLNDCEFSASSFFSDRCYEAGAADWLRAAVCD